MRGDSAAAGLYISQPFQPRLTDGRQSIGLSRRLSHDDGTPRIHSFRRLFEGTKLGPGDTITLLRDDGTVFMRHPEGPRSIGQSVAARPSLRKDPMSALPHWMALNGYMASRERDPQGARGNRTQGLRKAPG
ncbi:hypothetical protein [Cupriavidus basilensis]|uniref:hypothetical protein n=1 Tax=Cupriavidus basilensis TaxID=68895 RepID=UPI0039F70ED8